MGCRVGGREQTARELSLSGVTTRPSRLTAHSTTGRHLHPDVS